MLIFSGSSNQPLAAGIAQQLGLSLGNIELSTFANGERRVRVLEPVQGESVIVVQSFSHPVDSNILETLLILDALERMGAKQVTLVIPWLGYSLQDKVFREGEPIAAKIVAKMFSDAFAHRVLVLDLHNKSIPGFFSIPTQELSALSLLKQHVRDSMDTKNAVVVSPDFGGLKHADAFAHELDLPLANIDKKRDLSSGKVTMQGLHGEVEGKEAILIDDVINTGSTAIEAAAFLKDQGAKKVHFLATHAILANGTKKDLHESELDSIVITNSINHEDLPSDFHVLDCSEIFSSVLDRVS